MSGGGHTKSKWLCSSGEFLRVGKCAGLALLHKVGPMFLSTELYSKIQTSKKKKYVVGLLVAEKKSGNKS